MSSFWLKFIIGFSLQEGPESSLSSAQAFTQPGSKPHALLLPHTHTHTHTHPQTHQQPHQSLTSSLHPLCPWFPPISAWVALSAFHARQAPAPPQDWGPLQLTWMVSLVLCPPAHKRTCSDPFYKQTLGRLIPSCLQLCWRQCCPPSVTESCPAICDLMDAAH